METLIVQGRDRATRPDREGRGARARRAGRASSGEQGATAEEGRAPAAGRRTARETVIVVHLPLVRRLARRFSRGDPARDEDLVQAGVVGLILAVDRFDPDRGVPFVAYAIPTIVGSIQRYLRDTAPVVRGPRRLASASGRGDLAPVGGPRKRGGDTVSVVLVGEWPVVEAVPGAGAAVASPDRAIEAAAQRLTVVRLVSGLRPRDRTLIYLRFYEDESLAEIARRTGLSVSRVSRLINRALVTLRAELEALDVAR